MRHEIFTALQAAGDAESDGSGRRLYAEITDDVRQRGSVSLIRLSSGERVRPNTPTPTLPRQGLGHARMLASRINDLAFPGCGFMNL